MAFGKIFDFIYDSTVAEDWKTLITFQQLIILADKYGFVYHTPQSLARRTNIPLEILEHGISRLLEPDPNSQSQIEDGKRIIRMPPDPETGRQPHGWYIVNYEYYRQLMDTEARRSYMRNYMRNYRKSHVTNSGLQEFTKANSKQSLADLTHTDTDTDIKFNSPNSTAVELASFLRDEILKIQPKAKVPKTQPQFDKWAKAMDMMIRIDKRKPEHLREMITWLHTKNQARGDFAFVVKSPQALRDKFDRIEVAMSKGK